MVIAGWYKDPLDERMERYWDGTQWTEHTRPVPEPAGPNPQQSGFDGIVPPFSPQPDPYPDYGPTRRLGSISGWINRSAQIFTARRLPPIVLLFFVFQGLFAIVVGVLLWFVIDYFFVNQNDAGWVVFLVPVAFVALVLQTGVSLAGNHYMYWTHAGYEPPWQHSLARGIKRSPAVIALTVAVLIAVGGVVALLFAATGMSSQNYLWWDFSDQFVQLFIILVILAVPIVFFLGVRLAFFEVATVVGPDPMGGLQASWEYTRERFWAVFGRLLLVGLILNFIFGIVEASVSGILETIFGSVSSYFSADPIDILWERGLSVSGRELIPVVVSAGIFGLLTGARTVLDTSLLTSLYVEGGGEAEKDF